MNKKNLAVIGAAMSSMMTLGTSITAASAYQIRANEDVPNIAWPPFDIDKLTRKSRRWRPRNNGAFGKSAPKRK